MAFNLIWLYEKGDYFRKLLDEIIQLDLKKPLIGKVFNFNQLPSAIREFQSGKTFGKIVVKVD